MSQFRLLTAAFSLMLTGCFGADPEHTEYFPAANGNKPDIFELGFVQVCEDGSAAIEGVMRFANEQGMYKHEIAKPGERVLVVYTLGAPMKAHLMVERIHKDRFRIGISTFRGYSTAVVDAARKSDFCRNILPPPNNSFKPTPLRGAA
ncbi:hypothetical protein [Luteimonas arsenica]|uniref:hypothetical protein n=1 Tax=Luteimonas arsenica TaxID=1586242 RepID=UPI001054C496|nr:hypothetical protein [Luteimonas arsenica]